MRNLNTTELVQISGGDANAPGPNITPEQIPQFNEFLWALNRITLGAEAGNIDLEELISNDVGPFTEEDEATLWVDVGGELLDTSAEMLAQISTGITVVGAEGAEYESAQALWPLFSTTVEGNIGGFGEAFVGSTLSAVVTEIALSDVNNTALALTILDRASAISTGLNNNDATAIYDMTQIDAQDPSPQDIDALEATKLAMDSVIDIYNQVLPSFAVGEQEFSVNNVTNVVSDQPELWATVFSGSMLNGAATVIEAIANGEAKPEAMQAYFDGIQILLVDNGYLTEVESGTADNFGTGIFNAGASITAANAISDYLVT